MILTLHAQSIKAAVKADTYITGQIDKSADMVKNAALAYNEQAGDDTYHETKLYRTMKAAVAKFESHMAEYVDVASNTPISDTLSATTEDVFEITIPTGARFYGSFATTIANLAQEYIINMMLYTWWQSIKPTLAKDYYEFGQESIASIRRCLAKTPPNTAGSYVDVDGETERAIIERIIPLSWSGADEAWQFIFPKSALIAPLQDGKDVIVSFKGNYTLALHGWDDGYDPEAYESGWANGHVIPENELQALELYYQDRTMLCFVTSETPADTDTIKLSYHA